MLNSRQRKIRRRIADREHPELRAVFRSNPTAPAIRNFLAGMLIGPATISPTFELPLKHVRLQQLEDADFNTADRRYYLRGELSLENKLSELKDFLGLHKRLSVRTYREEKYGEPSPRLPVLYNVGQWSIIRDFSKENNKVNHSLVNQALRLEDTLCSGDLVLCDSETFLVSVTEGCGTPRSVYDKDDKLQVFMGQFGDPSPGWTPSFITNMAKSLCGFLPDLRPMTIEFSIYPYEIGKLKKHYVLWEWRGGVAEEIKMMVAHCLKQSRSFETTIYFPRARHYRHESGMK